MNTNKIIGMIKYHYKKYGFDETIFIPKYKAEFKIIEANLDDANHMFYRIGKNQKYKHMIKIYEEILSSKTEKVTR